MEQYKYWVMCTSWHMFLIILFRLLIGWTGIPLRFTFSLFWWFSSQTWRDPLGPKRQCKRTREVRVRGRRRKRRRGQLLICCFNLPLARSWPEVTGDKFWYHNSCQEKFWQRKQTKLSPKIFFNLPITSKEYLVICCFNLPLARSWPEATGGNF